MKADTASDASGCNIARVGMPLDAYEAQSCGWSCEAELYDGLRSFGEQSAASRRDRQPVADRGLLRTDAVKADCANELICDRDGPRATLTACPTRVGLGGDVSFSVRPRVWNRDRYSPLDFRILTGRGDGLDVTGRWSSQKKPFGAQFYLVHLFTLSARRHWCGNPVRGPGLSWPCD